MRSSPRHAAPSNSTPVTPTHAARRTRRQPRAAHHASPTRLSSMRLQAACPTGASRRGRTSAATSAPMRKTHLFMLAVPHHTPSRSWSDPDRRAPLKASRPIPPSVSPPGTPANRSDPSRIPLRARNQSPHPAMVDEQNLSDMPPWAALDPLRLLLMRVSQLQHGEIRLRRADDLHAHRHTLRIESNWHIHRRQAG
jgi:hypothetical protein